MFLIIAPTFAKDTVKPTSDDGKSVLSQNCHLRKQIVDLFLGDDFDEVAQTLDSLDFDVNLGVLEKIAVGLDQTHVCDLLAEVGGDFCEVFGKTESHPPRLVLSSLNDERHDECLILVTSEYLGDFFEALDGKDSDLILLISGTVFQDTDEIAEHVLLLVDPAHVGYLGGRNSLQEEHLLI